MTKAPKRPAGVPAKAWWDEGDKEWVFGPLVDGKKHGDFTFWRGDGTKCNECHMVMDVAQGPFKRFHENGELSQDGTFDEKGALHGTRRWFSTDGETTENTRAPGIHQSVWRSEMDYVHGRVVGIRHFNKDDERVLPRDGAPYPLRPASVADGAEYVEPKDEWHRGDADGETQKKVGRWRIWTREGVLKEDVHYEDGALHGKATLYVHGESPFTDPAIVQERGQFEHGQRVGPWALCDASGGELLRCDYGSGVPTAPRLAAYANTPGDWATLAKELEGEQRYAEALVTWARAAGQDKDSTGFRSLLTRVAKPVNEGAAVARASDSERPVHQLGVELLEGAHPAVLLNKIAIALDQQHQSRAALDFTNAAILLDPERSAFLFTRSLILMSLGLGEQAERDAHDLASESPDRAAFLLGYVRGLFPTWDFTPRHETPTTSFEDVPDGPVRSLEEVQQFVGKYATRLQLTREKLLERLTPENPAVPPDCAHLLPDGPVALHKGAVEMLDDDGDVREVEFDERPEVDGVDVPSLLRLARADWVALTWLCWSVGSESVAMPEAIVPPDDFGKAAGMAQQRLWRARDQRAFKGRNAQQHGVESFEWAGTDMAELPPPVAGIAEQQYADMQALFLWLVDAKLQTPWQDELRGS